MYAQLGQMLDQKDAKKTHTHTQTTVIAEEPGAKKLGVGSKSTVLGKPPDHSTPQRDGQTT